jgi:hypothetical protein
MVDLGIPEQPQEATGGVLTAIPAMPVAGVSAALYGASPHLVECPGQRYSIGWQDSRKVGPCFVVAEISAILGTVKVRGRFPLTEDGWAEAWRALVGLDGDAARSAAARLAARAAGQRAIADRARLDADSVCYLRDVIFLGGYLPGTELVAGRPYDLRFLGDRIAVLPCRGAEMLVEIPFGDVETVDIGGPGLVKSGGGFIGGGFGAAGAVEGMAIAAVLNSLTTQVKIKTIMRIQGTGYELFALYSKLAPDALRIELSRSLGAIREAQYARADSGVLRKSPARGSLVEELSKLASMLDAGLLTRDEFDHLKAKLIAEA